MRTWRISPTLTKFARVCSSVLSAKQSELPPPNLTLATCLGSYKLILEGALDFPRAIGHFTKDIVRRLLHPSVTKRLGCLRNGSADVRMHRWFADLNCQQLLRMKLPTPYIPKVRHGDLRHHSTHHHPLNTAPHARALTGARPNGHVQLSTLR